MNESTVMNLLGKWTTAPQDVDSLQKYGRVTLEFTKDGRLLYTIHSPGKEEVILLTYFVQDDVIVTNQPSSPREERTRYLLESDDRLVLFYGSYQSSYVRES